MSCIIICRVHLLRNTSSGNGATNADLGLCQEIGETSCTSRTTVALTQILYLQVIPLTFLNMHFPFLTHLEPIPLNLRNLVLLAYSVVKTISNQQCQPQGFNTEILSRPMVTMKTSSWKSMHNSHVSNTIPSQ